MAISANAVWEVRTAGADTNGGGFVTGASGTDYSQQDAANSGSTDKSTTDAVANGTTTITSATANFQSTIVGNIIYLQGGSGSLAVTRRQVTARTNATTITVDATVAAGTGITMNIGGALASPGEGGRNWVSGHKLWIKAGTYTVTTTSTNVSNGCFVRTGQDTYIEGYQTTRGDLGTKPLIKADGVITTFTLVDGGTTNGLIANIAVDGNSRTSSRGLISNGPTLSGCTAANCTNNGIVLGVRFTMINCAATGCSTQAAIASNGLVVNCVAHTNTVTGFVSIGSSSQTTFVNCLAYDNSGASSDGFNLPSGQGNAFLNCTAYGNGRDGFRNGTHHTLHVNCLAEGNTGTGFNASGTPLSALYFNCATYNNGTAFSIGAGKGSANIGSITGTSSFFTNAAGADFSLNNTAGGGGAVRGVGLPSTLPAGVGVGYIDLGALQTGAGAPAGTLAAFVGAAYVG